MFGCLRSLGCLVLLAIVAVAAWVFRDRWTPLLNRGGSARPVATAPATAGAWEPLTAQGAARAREAINRLGSRSGPVFASLRPGDLSAYILQEVSRQLPPSARNAEAAVIDDKLFVRATVRLSEFGGTKALGPLASVLGDREPVQFGGTLDIVRPGLAQYRVQALRIRDLSIPRAMIPRLIRNIERGPHPEGVADDALPLEVPPYIGDVRVKNGKITLYKAVQ